MRLSAGGKTTRERRRFDTSTSGRLAWLTGQGCTRVAIEATEVY